MIFPTKIADSCYGHMGTYEKECLVSVRLINKPIFFKTELSKYIPGRPLDIFIIAPPKIGVHPEEFHEQNTSFSS